MQMTRYSDYSLRTLIYLGLHRHRRCTIREIADAYGISENHLMKLVHQLGREGFVRTTRGKNGGLELARPAREIGVGAVFRAMEGNFHLVECFKEDGNTCPIAGPCVLSGVLDEALQAFLEVLDRHTLEDLLAPSQALGRIFAARQEAAIRLQ
ncbi:MAG: Rrf2 family transcriptional regulator [Alphaproteobacteria bacterium]|nr:Rrf2 family transcriptional regulator [Alphaproteobacteria bacterium]MYE02059.1 Rrf2 family transcriptional regulator [Alphaproteobacteria bacterium]